MTITTHFTTTNGYELIRYDDAKGSGGANLRDPDGRIMASFSEPTWVALTEAVTHERDTDLGRWRDPKNPEHLYYPLGTDRVRLIHEGTSNARTFQRENVDQEKGWGADGASRYFAAHPVKQPWHDAKEGEVWLLAFSGDDPAPVIAIKDDDDLLVFQFGDIVGEPSYIGLGHPGITAGRRIWPEVTE